MLWLVASAVFAARMWSWVLHFDPGFSFTHQAVPTGAPLSSGVTVLLVDGLRLDASRRMPTLNALRVRGAAIDATVGTPSFSRPGRATIAVGAPPSIHGVTTNRQKRVIPLDNLIRRVGAAGGTCRIAGSKIWSGLFAEDIARCGVYQEGEGKEGPGMFVQQVPAIRAAQEKGIEFVIEKPAMLRIADIISTDFAAHEYGGASPEYQAELQRIDAMIAVLSNRLDLSRETLVITADHGHRDQGGHGGEEAEVLAIPIVMVGAGIKSSVTVNALQADIAPTIAALLGVGLPTASSGQPIEAILLADDAKLAMIKGASVMQREAFDKVVSERLAIEPGLKSGWTASVESHRDATRRGRTLAAAFCLLVLPLLAFAAIRLAGPDPWSLIAGAAVGLVVLVGPVRSQIPSMSFSAINYDEMLIPFFVKVMTLAALTTLASIGSALFVGRVYPKRIALDSPVAEAGAVGLMGATLLAMILSVYWWRDLLLSPLSLSGPGAMVVGYCLTLSILSVSLTALIVSAVASVAQRRASTQNPRT